MTMPVDVKVIIFAENDQPNPLWDEQKLFPCQFVVAVGDAYNPGRRLKFVVGILRSFSLMSQKFGENLQTMAAAEGGTQIPPESPFFKGRISSVGLKPLFGKEGKGRFLAERRRSYVANFWDRTLA